MNTLSNNERIEQLKAELAQVKAQAEVLWVDYKQKDAELVPVRERWNIAFKKAEKLQQQIEWLSELQEKQA